eukprot:11827073-Alexandrium_andersonii.AAC.1
MVPEAPEGCILRHVSCADAEHADEAARRARQSPPGRRMITIRIVSMPTWQGARDLGEVFYQTIRR